MAPKPRSRPCASWSRRSSARIDTLPREITAFSNPLIKRVRGLREKRHRREEGLFLAEGLRILAEAEEAGILPDTLFFAADSAQHPIVRRLSGKVEAQGGEAIETSRDILHKLS